MPSSNSTTPPADSQAPYLLENVDKWSDLWEWLAVCPHSQTMTAYDLDLESSLIYALPCNQWSCRHCAIRKTKSLAHKTVAAKPNRLCTLTTDPKLYDHPRAAFDATRRRVPEWARIMRRRFGSIEYLRVTEVTKKGWPHYHLLIRSGYLPHEVAKNTWALLTGASIVDIRQVKKVFNCYTYLLKYLTKMHRIEWTGRHVSYSKDFFMPDDRPEYDKRRLELRMVHNVHPATYIREEHKGEPLVKISPRTYRAGEDRELTGTIKENEVPYWAPDPWTETADDRRVLENTARQEFMAWVEAEPPDIGRGPDGQRRHTKPR